MRGDRPWFRFRTYLIVKFTPHARGSTYWRYVKKVGCQVYPACAGIDRLFSAGIVGQVGLPRMRGDRPYVAVGCQGGLEFTPHARGSTHATSSSLQSACVYPACAGIDRGLLCQPLHTGGLPRMRGDRPCPHRKRFHDSKFTPHARGSTLSRSCRRCLEKVYPACAGIDPPS